MNKKIKFKFSYRAQSATGSIIREILKLLSLKGLISFAGGLPAPELFPIDELRRITDYVLKNKGEESLQYSITEGLPHLRKALSRRFAKKGMHIPYEQILITSGAQQALDLIGKVFINPGDKVVAGSPTYLGAVQAFNAYQAAYITIPLDDHGMRVDLLEQRLKKERTKPKLMYLVPDFQNPTGRTIPLNRRKRILLLAHKYSIPVVEDDPYSELRFAGKHIPSIKSLDTKGLVIYVGTFSKIISPGLRLGWACADQEIMKKLIIAKQAGDLHCGTLVQNIADRFIRLGFLDKHIQLIRDVYKRRRDVMVQCLHKFFPSQSHWVDSEGGLFIWVVLPKRYNTSRMLKKAVAANVAYVPGMPFYPYHGGENTLRLNFSNATPAQIKRGMKRLGNIINGYV
ncbi:MAG: PLP-dependent aminotransferase family protein [bacterium]